MFRSSLIKLESENDHCSKSFTFPLELTLSHIRLLNSFVGAPRINVLPRIYDSPKTVHQHRALCSIDYPITDYLLDYYRDSLLKCCGNLLPLMLFMA